MDPVSGAIIKCNYELCDNVINKSNTQSKTPPRATLIQGTISYEQLSLLNCLGEDNIEGPLINMTEHTNT
jgi:hypothetical protein